MSFPSWLAYDGSSLNADAPELIDLVRLLDIVAPERTAQIPLSVAQVLHPPAVERKSFVGTAALWGSDEARFGIEVDGNDRPELMWVSKPVVIAPEVAIPGLGLHPFWMIITIETPAVDPSVSLAELTGDPDARPFYPIHRHLVGTFSIGGRTQLARLNLQGDTVLAELDFTDTVTELERQAIGTELPERHAGLGFTDLASLFGNDHHPSADLEWLPESLQALDYVQLDDAYFRIATEPNVSLETVGVKLGFAGHRSWTLIPGFDFLTVGNLQADLVVESPLDSLNRSPMIGLTGEVGLGDATVEVTTTWPHLAVSGHLLHGHQHPIRVNDLLAALHLPAIGRTGPTIDQLAFEARPMATHPTFSVDVGINDVLSIDIGTGRLQVRRLEGAFSLLRGPESTLDTRLSGTLAFDDAHELLVLAENEHGGHGWRFFGSLHGDAVHLSSLNQWMADNLGFDPIPHSLADATEIDRFGLSYATAASDLSLDLAMAFDIHDSEHKLVLELDVDLSHHGGGRYERRLGGRFSVDRFHFDLLEAKTGGESQAGDDQATQNDHEILLGSFRNETQDGEPATIGAFLKALGVDLNIPVAIADAVVAHHNDGSLALVDLATGFDLHHLPLVGGMLGAEANLGLTLRVLGASGTWGQEAIDLANQTLPEGLPALRLAEGQDTLPHGAVSGTLSLGSQSIHLDDLGLALHDSATTTGNESNPASSVAAGQPNHTPLTTGDDASSAVQWAPIQRSFGPVHVRRVGVDFDVEQQTIGVLVDGALSLGGITLSLDGLGVHNPLDRFDPTFTLRGLGLELDAGAVSAGGTFLKLNDHEFAGALTLQMEDLALSAIGAYGEYDGNTSMFVYAVLDYPLGGPSFFFVTGLAAGFGYNRKLVMPSVDQVAEFPLVKEAVAGAAGAGPPDADGLTEKLNAIATYVPYSDGDLFFAVGLKFNSFKLLDTFVLVAVSVGHQTRIDALGLTTLVVPTPIPGSRPTPLAEIQIAIKASVVPDEGFVGVDARLTPASFVISRKCHLRGGAAFYAWFDGPHSGDIVATVGGYHPHFKRPAHFPVVPRLSLEWHVTSELSVKGSMYFALTGNALMAGGSLEATYHSGSLRAWFKAGADFLVVWQPYHYEASMYINVGGSWHGLSAEVGASLQVWGPDFAGTAEVDLGITSFDLDFGPAKKAVDSHIGWDAFQHGSLPPAEQICTVSCQRGQLHQLTPDTDDVNAEWVVSAADLIVGVSSQIPASGYRLNGLDADLPSEVETADLGIRPVGIEAGDLVSPIEVSLTRVGEDGKDEPFQMDMVPVVKSVPSALWGGADGTPAIPFIGQSAKPGVNGERTVAGTLSGFAFKPRKRPEPNSSKDLDREKLGWSPVGPRTATIEQWLTEPFPIPDPDDFLARRRDDQSWLRQESDARAALLLELGFDPGELQPGPDLSDHFRQTPRVSWDPDPTPGELS